MSRVILAEMHFDNLVEAEGMGQKEVVLDQKEMTLVQNGMGTVLVMVHVQNEMEMILAQKKAVFVAMALVQNEMVLAQKEMTLVQNEMVLIQKKVVFVAMALAQNEMTLVQNEMVLAQNEIVFAQKKVVFVQKEVALAQNGTALVQNEMVLAQKEMEMVGVGEHLQINRNWTDQKRPNASVIRAKGVGGVVWGTPDPDL